MTERGTTPSQTVGPYLSIGLTWPGGADVVAEGTAGAVVVEGTLTDGAGDVVPDGLVEIWQADPDGRFAHPDAPERDTTFRGFGRCATDAGGRFRFRTVRPGALPGGDGSVEAPHLDVSVFARGMVHRLVTRMYFPDFGDANAVDPVLAGLEGRDRAGLTAVAVAPDRYRFDISLQGDDETPFFAL